MARPKLPLTAYSVKRVHDAAAAVQANAKAQLAEQLAALKQQAEQVRRLDELLKGLAPAELAKAATRPALRFALETIENKRRPYEDRLKAATLILGLGHAHAPKQVELDASITESKVITREDIRRAALAFAADDATEAEVRDAHAAPQ